MRLILADTTRHAEVMMTWMNLDRSEWFPAPYGIPLSLELDEAILIRPLEGITSDHFAWIVGVLMPRLKHGVHLVPDKWAFLEMDNGLEAAE